MVIFTSTLPLKTGHSKGYIHRFFNNLLPIMLVETGELSM